MYFHIPRDLRTFLYGDGLATIGARDLAKCFTDALDIRFEINSPCVGDGAITGGWQSVAGSTTGPAATIVNGETMKEASEGRLLNRVLRCTTTGWGVEEYQRHADLIVRDLKLDRAHGVIIPGENEPARKYGGHDEALSSSGATIDRGIAARANYLAADRLNIMYSVQELC